MCLLYTLVCFFEDVTVQFKLGPYAKPPSFLQALQNLQIQDTAATSGVHKSRGLNSRDPSSIRSGICGFISSSPHSISPAFRLLESGLACACACFAPQSIRGSDKQDCSPTRESSPDNQRHRRIASLLNLYFTVHRHKKTPPFTSLESHELARRPHYFNKCFCLGCGEILQVAD